jgi:hypothetical protein
MRQCRWRCVPSTVGRTKAFTAGILTGGKTRTGQTSVGVWRTANMAKWFGSACDLVIASPGYGCPGDSVMWRTHSCVPCRQSCRHLFRFHGRSVETSLDAARTSARATVVSQLTESLGQLTSCSSWSTSPIGTGAGRSPCGRACTSTGCAARTRARHRERR